jgi:DNA-binding MarR family transcriptional regulator
MGREAMATPRVSRLQKHILRVLLTEHHRTHGRISMGHLELVKALGGDKSNISHSLRTLETRGWIVIGRTLGGRAESLELTPVGLEKASELYL